jgi:hypothetical protein
MQLLAMYLPQFHRVKENDEWWGEGFTDWIPTKNAKPICEGHYQPHIPLNHNYYDLMKKETMLWQAELMHKYGVDGMCMYHYYFKDGRKILEKPAEQLLRWKDVDMPFCFYWANETWKRSWSSIPNANSWQSDEKKPFNSTETGILLDQQYGDREDWVQHFNYFLPFFKDKRYIKVNGSPLLIIYKTALIPCLKQMLGCWRELAEKEGFTGLYIIGAYANDNAKKSLDGILYHEPPQTLVSLREGGVGNHAYSISYDTMVDNVLKEPPVGKRTFYSCFTGFDDTPRRGETGNALKDTTPEKYQDFLARTIAKNYAAGNDFTFINAWNEWGEGMHLEPDEKYGYAYLEATYHAKKDYEKYVEEYKKYSSMDVGNDILYLQNKADKFEQYMRLLDRWMELREKDISLKEYLDEKNIKKVAIYGYGNFGRHLYWELKKSGVDVSYVIDRYGDKVGAECKVYLPEDHLPECDAIIVTTFWIFEDIRDIIPRNHRLISLDEIISSFRER